jgi:superfamily II DNA/RNA helicase
MRFRDAVEKIQEFIPESSSRQTLVFSATMAAQVHSFVDSFVRDFHVVLKCVPKEGLAKGHQQVTQKNVQSFVRLPVVGWYAAWSNLVAIHE